MESNNMGAEHKCSTCGKALEANAPGGLCPECLIKVGLGSGVDPGADTKTGATRRDFVPPAVEKLGPLFPQLEILELIGKGGMGAVYKARQRELDRIVALKILPPDVGLDAAFAGRFTREARALARLNHPGIVTIHDFGRADGLYFFLMEYVDGVSLQQLLRGGRVSAREALAIVPQICDALQYAHDQGIVHRDIKPGNILLDRCGRVKVADFGLAKLVGTDALTPSLSHPMGEGGAAAPGEGSSAPVLSEASKVMGTPQYMSPEQISAPGEVDHRADIYALGVVFYQMLTGELPGKPIEAPSRKVRIDVRLDEVVLRALEQKPELRYQQASVLKTQIETIVSTPGSSRREEAQTEKSEIGNQKSEMPSRFSRTAIVGACWFPFVIVALFAKFVGWPAKPAPPAWVQILSLLAVLLGFAAPFGTTILGWMAVKQIRRTAGKFHGLCLAVFDELLFPLLALDALIFMVYLAVAYLIRELPYSAAMEVVQTVMMFGLGLLSIGLMVWLDIYIIRRVWRAENDTNPNSAASGPVVQKPGPFWRRRTVLLVILVPLGIVLVAMVLPVRAWRSAKGHTSQSNWPEIESVEVSTDKAVVKQRSFHGEGLLIMFGTMTNRWEPGGLYIDSMFDITLEWPWFRRDAANWVIKSRDSIYMNYSLDGPPGPMVGKIVFHPGTPAPEADGSYVIGEFRPDVQLSARSHPDIHLSASNSVPLPIAVRLVRNERSQGSALPAHESQQEGKASTAQVSAGKKPQTETNAEILKIQLEQAEKELTLTEQRYKTGVGVAGEFYAAQDEVALLKAELGGDPVEIAKVNLAAAQRRMENAEMLYRLGITGSSDCETAKTEFAIAKAKWDEATKDRTGGSVAMPIKNPGMEEGTNGAKKSP